MDDIVDLDAPMQDAQTQGGWTENLDGTRTMRLSRPVKMRLRQGGAEREEVLNSLTFRRCNGGDLRHMGAAKNEIDRSAILFSRLAGISMASYDRLDCADIEAGMECIAGFLPSAPKTGTTSSD